MHPVIEPLLLQKTRASVCVFTCCAARKPKWILLLHKLMDWRNERQMSILHIFIHVIFFFFLQPQQLLEVNR